MSRLHPTFLEPDIRIHDTALDAWKQGQLENAEALLTASIPTSPNPNHHAFASRALVRSRLGQWDAALTDARQVWYLSLSSILVLTLIYAVNQNSALPHWVCCKKCSACPHGRNAERISGL